MSDDGARTKFSGDLIAGSRSQLRRFTITSTHTTNDDLLNDWGEIRSVTTQLLEELNVKVGDRAKVSLKG